MGNESRGLAAVLGAFLIWGLSPAFWKLLTAVPAVQLLTHRVLWAAVLLFVINIIGLALGPALTGALSDALEPRLGEDALRYALLIVSLALAWSALHFHLAGRTLVADLELTRRQSERADGADGTW